MATTPSTSWWDAVVSEVEHPINAVESAYSEISDPNVTIAGAAGATISGRPPQSQVDAIKQQTAQNVLNAGGSQADADAAAAEVQSYVDANGGTADQWVANNLPSAGTVLGLGAGTIVILALLAYILHEV